MELGNMIFGNSRGEYPVPRTAAFEEPWREMHEALKISWRGEPEDGCLVPETTNWYGVENDVFRIRTYDWDAECDCGADAKMDAWHDANPHGPDCYQTELHARRKSWEDRSGYTAAHDLAFGQNDSGLFPGMNAEIEHPAPGVMVGIWTPRTDHAMEAWRQLSARRDKIENALYDELCTRHGLDRKYGCAVHCTCGRDTRAGIFWDNVGGHSSECRFVQPNFLYKPTGFSLNWYKYPFRDSYMSQPLKPKQWREMMRACVESASPPVDRGAPDRILRDSEASPHGSTGGTL